MVWCGHYLGGVSLVRFDFIFDSTLMLRRGLGITLMAKSLKGGSQNFELLILGLSLCLLCC